MEQLRMVVENIFNNWSALQLAVEHGMGGSTSREIAIQSVDYLTNYCITEINNIDTEDIEDVLVDIMDEEYQTICEDDSPKEIACLVYKFLQLIKSGDTNQFQIEYNNLPKSNKDWLNPSTAAKIHTNVNPEIEVYNISNETASSSAAPMDEDQEWTEVKTRRKK